MRQLRTQKQLRDYLFSVPMLVVFAVLLVFALRAAWGSFGEFARAAEARAALQAELAALEEEKEELERTAVETPSRALEREAREKFGLARPGEEVIVIVDEGISPDGLVVSSPAPWWRRLLNWVINK